MFRFYYILLFCLLGMGCAATPSRQAGNPADVKKIMRESQTNKEALNAIDVVAGSLIGEGVIVKYCPKCGARYSAKIKVCPKDTTLLKEVEE